MKINPYSWRGEVEMPRIVVYPDDRQYSRDWASQLLANLGCSLL
jgi:hypothetical protein